MTLLLAEKITISKEYSDVLDIFSQKRIAILPDYLNINKYLINLQPGK